MPDGLKRRRGDEQVLHSELRATLQPLFDMKARVEPAIRFWEINRRDIEEFLPGLLHNEDVRQILAGQRKVNWRRLYYLAIVIGGLSGLAVIGSFALNLYFLWDHVR